jgi:hypothetical protein
MTIGGVNIDPQIAPVKLGRARSPSSSCCTSSAPSARVSLYT